MRVLFFVALALTLFVGPGFAQQSDTSKNATEVVEQPAKPAAKSEVKIKPSQLIVRPKSKGNDLDFRKDPRGWVEAKQRVFYEKMSKAIRQLRMEQGHSAAWLLLAMSFVYGVLHAAGPGHGKAVVSAWLLANEQQLRRGVIIAAMAAFIQALTAIVIVSGVLLFVNAAGTKARFIANSLEAISFGLIGLLGVFLIWRTLKDRFASADAHAGHHHSHDHHHHSDHHHNHTHDEDCPAHQVKTAECGCGHAHMPTAQDVSGDWSWPKAFSLAFAVGIRPCSGAILVLLLSSSIGLYWAGVASTFAMAIGTGITVSLVAVLTVTSKNLALKLTGQDSQWFDRILFGVKLLAGIFIMTSGAFLFWATLPRVL